jgi:hypothetical protein
MRLSKSDDYSSSCRLFPDTVDRERKQATVAWSAAFESADGVRLPIECEVADHDLLDHLDSDDSRRWGRGDGIRVACDNITIGNRHVLSPSLSLASISQYRSSVTVRQ